MLTKLQNAKYWRAWAAVCRARGWKSSHSEGRHSLHVLALGRDKSHVDLTNPEFSRVLATFALQVYPSSITARLTLDDPDRESGKRVDWAISRFAPALVQRLACDKFAGADWRGLDIVRRRQLLMTLKRIQREQVARVGASHDDPF